MNKSETLFIRVFSDTKDRIKKVLESDKYKYTGMTLSSYALSKLMDALEREEKELGIKKDNNQ